MQLKKELGFIEIFALATGAMISSGIFILPGLAFTKAGPAVFLSYFFAGLLALTGVFSFAEVTSAMPKAGGDYFIATRSLGPLTGTVSGLLSWFAISLKTAFAILGIAEILHILLGFPFTPSALVICLLFTVINIVGVKESGKFEVIIVMLLLAAIVYFILRGLFAIDILRFEPFSPHGFHDVLYTSGFVFVAYGGLLKIASIAEEVKQPQKTIPLGLFSSLFVVMILYSLMLIVTVGTLDGNKLADSLTPIADAAKSFLGQPGYIIMTSAALLAFVSTANAGILAASRYPFALSRDMLLPDFLNRINRHFKTPIRAILLTSAFITLAILLPLETLVKSASTVVIVTYILSHLAIIILRESKMQNYLPGFRAPFYPWIQIIGLFAFTFLLIDMGFQIIIGSAVLALLGVIIYFLYGKRRNTQEYAFLHLIARITNKAVRSNNLEKELKAIIQHRDDIALDRFDHIVEQSDILDLDCSYDLNHLFNLLAEEISSRSGLPREMILESLIERENDSSTAISPFIAIPHIILEGANSFDLIIVRCREGIKFSEEYPEVKAVFVLYGSRDERNFHLQALASIAQIVQSRDFESRWLKARSKNNLRDLILLAERKRLT